MKIHFHIMVAALCFVITGCLQNKETAGGAGHEGEALIAGRVVETESGAASGVVVTLYPRDFNPLEDDVPQSMRAITREGGEYLFIISDTGTYNIQAFKPENNHSTLLRSIEVTEVNGDTLSIADAIIKEPGSIVIQTEELTLEEEGHLYIPGTGINTQITSENLSRGYTTIEAPPAAYHTVNYAEPGETSGSNVLEEELEVLPGQAAIQGPFAGWSDTLQVSINTSADGADVGEDVTDFPLLIRLNSSFPFNMASADGSDLRFSRDGFTPLPYEIESWDAGGEAALVWVLVDTVFGHSSSQKIMMYAGNSSATGQSSGSGVFSEYFGSWHLGDDPLGTQPQFSDASGNQNPAGGGNKRAEHAIEGVIGGGLDFTGAGQFLTTDLRTINPSVFTISTWFKADSAGGQLMMFAGDSGELDRNIYMGSDGSLHFGLFPLAPDSIPPEDSIYFNPGFGGPDSIFPGIQRILTAAGPYNDGQWHQVTAGLSSDGQVFYVDGLEVGRNTSVISGTNFTGYWQMGQHNNSSWVGSSERSYYIGALDEVRVIYQAPSAVRIKLEYENQKENSTNVTIE